jgi:hypothetical protein
LKKLSPECIFSAGNACICIACGKSLRYSRQCFDGENAVHGNWCEGAGTMDISEQLRTWRAFTGFVKWVASGVGIVVLVLIIIGLCG